MSNPIRKGAEFGTLAEFDTAFEQYCRNTIIDGQKAHFIGSHPELIKDGDYDAVTKNTFKYKKRNGYCKFRKAGCDAKYHLRLETNNDGQKVLRITEFNGNHKNHTSSAQNSNPLLNIILKELSKAVNHLDAPQQDGIVQVLQNLLHRTQQSTQFTVTFSDQSNGTFSLDYTVHFCLKNRPPIQLEVRLQFTR